MRSMGSEGGDKEIEKGKELRERAIAAIRAHNNYRGKPLGNLPRWLEKLCTTEQFRAHADTLKNDNALATYAVEQVKHYSRKQGEPWDFEVRLYNKGPNTIRHFATTPPPIPWLV